MIVGISIGGVIGALIIIVSLIPTIVSSGMVKNKIIIKALRESEDAFKLENKSASLSTSVNTYH